MLRCSADGGVVGIVSLGKDRDDPPIVIQTPLIPFDLELFLDQLMSAPFSITPSPLGINKRICVTGPFRGKEIAFDVDSNRRDSVSKTGWFSTVDLEVFRALCFQHQCITRDWSVYLPMVPAKNCHALTDRPIKEVEWASDDIKSTLLQPLKGGHPFNSVRHSNPDPKFTRIAFICNVERCHWVTTVVETKRVYVIDFFNSTCGMCHKEVFTRCINDFNIKKTEATFVFVRANAHVKQRDSHSCGPIACLVLLSVLRSFDMFQTFSAETYPLSDSSMCKCSCNFNEKPDIYSV